MSAPVDTGFAVRLFGGPFHGAVRPLLAPEHLGEPPAELHVFLCACCSQITPITLTDLRRMALLETGRTPTPYRCAQRADEDVTITYEYAP